MGMGLFKLAHKGLAGSKWGFPVLVTGCSTNLKVIFLFPIMPSLSLGSICLAFIHFAAQPV
jgi:hypothetical protein